MRYTLVFTASLCIGLASGFIAPAGAPKIIEDNDIINESKNFTVPNNHSRVEGRQLYEKSLYEHATKNENNLYTRSSIFINQGYIAPMRQIYDAKYKEISQKNKNVPIQSSLTDLEIAHYSEFPYRFSAGFPQPSMKEGKVKDRVPGHYNAVIDQLNNEGLVNNWYGKGLNNIEQSQTNEKEDQQNYLELLKPPLIRPKSYVSRKITYEHLNKNGLSEIFIKHCDKTQNSPQMLFRNNIDQKPVKNFRGIARLHLLQKSAYGNKQFIYNPEDFDFNSQLATDVSHRRLGAKESGEKSIRYNQKDTYSEILSNGKKFVNYEKCNYPDCVLSAGKQRDGNKNGCDCHYKRERLSRQGLKYNETAVFVDSPKNNDSNVISDEDSTNKAINDELLKTINKLNYTLEMYH